MIAPLQLLWGYYMRWTVRWPALAAFVPFIPLIALWSLIVWLGVFPRAFLPGPLDVLNKGWALLYKGILNRLPRRQPGAPRRRRRGRDGDRHSPGRAHRPRPQGL